MAGLMDMLGMPVPKNMTGDLSSATAGKPFMGGVGSGGGGGGAQEGLGMVQKGAGSIGAALGQIGSALGGGGGGMTPQPTFAMKKGGSVKKYTHGGKINLDSCGVSTHQKSKKSPNW
jgi:hypothetical protein